VKVNVPEIQYEKADYSDILAKDGRYDSRAYDFVLEVIHEAGEAAKGHVTGQELLGFFRDLALDAYGPLAYTVLSDWGLKCCEDVGAVVFNLYDSGRIGKTDSDSPEDFVGGFDFKQEFLGPYAV
jgi:uncharacterized repeat protein (TIGR04138 family)